MAYSNPFQMMASMMPQNYQSAPTTQTPQFDPEQFRQFAITLNDTSLSNFAQMARMQGISEQDIQQGIQFIKSL